MKSNLMKMGKKNIIIKISLALKGDKTITNMPECSLLRKGNWKKYMYKQGLTKRCN